MKKPTSVFYQILAPVGVAAALVIGGAFAAAAGPPQSGALTPPTVPVGAAYLGAWVNPLGLLSNGGANEIPQLPAFNRLIGKPVAILHVYTLFSDPFPAETLAAVEQNGSIPLVDWSCASVTRVNSGAEDATITAEAQAFKTFGKPAFLRWYWEMNLNSYAHRNCGGARLAAGFVAAWQRIWGIFHQVGATNVAFVWCPSSHGDASPWYPGDAYVDWIGADGYDRDHTGSLAFHHDFAHFYGQWAGRHKPLMVGETGATTVDQALYISAIRTQLPATYPQFKAIMYMDFPGDAANWSLQGTGVTAFKSLADAPYFSYR